MYSGSVHGVNQNNVVMTAPSFADSTAAPKMSNYNIQLLAEAYGFDMSNEQMAMTRIPNGTKSLMAYVWMEAVFNLIGDVQPNSDEIHLESMSNLLINLYNFFKSLNYR